MSYGQLCQKISTQFVVAPTKQTITLIMLKLFPDLTPLLKVDHFEGFLNWCKIDGMMNDNLSSCNFLKNSKKMICNI